ncbi:MAG: hypothetical protein OET63_17165, partial [Desulfobacterales bacterium]|nr:hypothetical protein [Desulfobacterales bacterium]
QENKKDRPNIFLMIKEGCYSCKVHELVRFAHTWPPARKAYAPEGIMEQWNDGIMGYSRN